MKYGYNFFQRIYIIIYDQISGIQIPNFVYNKSCQSFNTTCILFAAGRHHTIPSFNMYLKQKNTASLVSILFVVVLTIYTLYVIIPNTANNGRLTIAELIGWYIHSIFNCCFVFEECNKFEHLNDFTLNIFSGIEMYI